MADSLYTFRYCILLQSGQKRANTAQYDLETEMQHDLGSGKAGLGDSTSERGSVEPGKSNISNDLLLGVYSSKHFPMCSATTNGGTLHRFCGLIF